MNNDIYEVEREDYAGFIGQLNKLKCDVEQYYEENMTTLEIYSKATNMLLCSRTITDEGEEHYYVFNMPEDNERVAPKPIRKVTLDTKEAVQEFFSALSKLQ